MIGWVLAVVLVALSMTATGWLWIPTVVALYWKVGRHFYLKGSKWRQVHFPFMRAYAQAAGFMVGLADQARMQFDVNAAVFQTLKSQYPQSSDDEVRKLIEQAVDAGRAFAWRSALWERLKQRNPRLSDPDLSKSLDKIASKFAAPDNSLMVRFVVLELVRRLHGDEAALEYLVAILAGRAT